MTLSKTPTQAHVAASREVSSTPSIVEVVDFSTISPAECARTMRPEPRARISHRCSTVSVMLACVTKRYRCQRGEVLHYFSLPWVYDSIACYREKIGASRSSSPVKMMQPLRAGQHDGPGISRDTALPHAMQHRRSLTSKPRPMTAAWDMPGPSGLGR